MNTANSRGPARAPGLNLSAALVAAAVSAAFSAPAAALSDGITVTTGTGSASAKYDAVAAGDGASADLSGVAIGGKFVETTHFYEIDSEGNPTGNILETKYSESEYYDAATAGRNGVAVGTSSTAAEDSVAIGAFASATGYGTTTDAENLGKNGSVAIGTWAAATASGAAALGDNASATAEGAAAYGFLARASGMRSFAGGTKSAASAEESVAIGDSAAASADGAVAVGADTKASAANAAAFGRGAEATAAGAFALGSDAEATITGSVALGYQSTTGHIGGYGNQEAKLTVWNVTLGNDAFAGTTGIDSTVSVGSLGNERTITNVAAGSLTSSSTDAVNGSQLWMAYTAIDAMGSTVDGVREQVSILASSEVTGDGANITVTPTQNYDQDGNLESISWKVALEDDIALDSVTAADSIAVGNIADKNGFAAIKDYGVSALYGETSLIVTDGKFAGGTEDAGVWIEKDEDTGKNTASLYADGSGFETSEDLARITGGDTVVTVADGAVDIGGAKLTNVEAGTEDTDGVNLAQLKEAFAEANGAHSTVEAGDTNITVTSETDGETGAEHYTVSLAKDIKVDSIAAGDPENDQGFVAGKDGTFINYGDTNVTIDETGGFSAGKGDTYVQADGTTAEIGTANSGLVASDGKTEIVGGDTKVTVSDAGVSMGGATITNAGEATERTDVANWGQVLDKIGNSLSANASVANGDNLVLDTVTAESGRTEYRLSLAKDLEGLNSVETKAIQAGVLTADESGASVKKGSAAFAVATDAEGRDAIAAVIGDAENPKAALALTEDGIGAKAGGTTVAVSDAGAGITTEKSAFSVSDAGIGAKTGDSQLVIAEKSAAIASGDASVTVTDGAATIKGGSTTVKITDAGMDMGGAKITGVADATERSDAVNFGQMQDAIGKVAASHTTVSAGDNVTVEKTENAAGGSDYRVSLANDIKVNSVATEAITVGDKDGNHVIADSTGISVKTSDAQFNVKEGEGIGAKFGDSAFALTKDGAAVTGKNSGFVAGDSASSITGGGTALTVSETGVAVNGKKITGLAAGDISAGSADAVTGGQLYATNQAVAANASSIESLWKKNGELNKKINRTGANAAALAALHPLDFDEDHKVSASVGIGQYHGTGALAVGVFIRPTENLMLSLGGSFASDDRMMNAGLSYRFGASGQPYETKAGMAQKVTALTAENRDLASKLAASDSKLEAANAKIDDLTAKIAAIEAKLANLR